MYLPSGFVVGADWGGRKILNSPRLDRPLVVDVDAEDSVNDPEAFASVVLPLATWSSVDEVGGSLASILSLWAVVSVPLSDSISAGQSSVLR